MKEKHKLIYTIIGIAIVLVLVIGSSYAYFSGIFKNDRTAEENGNANMGATNVAQATMVSNVPNAAGSFDNIELFPGHKEVIALSVSATGKKDSASFYQFVYDVEENTLNDNIKTYLYVSDTPIVTTSNYFNCAKKVDTTSDPARYYEECEEKDLGNLLEEARLSGRAEKKVLGKDSIKISVDDETIEKYYYVVVEFENKPEDQNEYQNKKLNGKINVEVIPYFENTILPPENEGTIATEYITKLSENSSELITDETEDQNIRYIGANPNNYVLFNDELWRIVGVMNNVEDQSGKKEKRLKIVRATSYESNAWDSNGGNVWENATLKNMLNETYLNGLSSKSKAHFHEVVWHLGTTPTTVTPIDIYKNEVGDGTLRWTGNIGLIYPSDYALATSGGENATRNQCEKMALNTWGSSKALDCRNNNWMYHNGNAQWTMISEPTKYVYIIHSVGYAAAKGSSSSFSSYPTLYLNTDVRIYDGNGTEESPFEIETNIPDTMLPVARFVIKKEGNDIVIDASSSTDNKKIKTYYYSKDGEDWITSNQSSYTLEKTNVITYGKGVDALANLSKNDFSTIYVKVEDSSGNMSEIVMLNVDGLIEDDTIEKNLRYIGASPNNYIDIEDRDSDGNLIPWRIIGVMNDIDDGNGTTESRIKIIRSESIGKYSWDTSPSNINDGKGVNEWSQADVMKLLNPGYESEGVGGSLYWNRKNGRCYVFSSMKMESCDFTNNGLSEGAQKYIGDALWNTGSGGKYTTGTMNDVNYSTTSQFYKLERSNDHGKNCTTSQTGSSCNDTIKRTTKWVGKVGLQYLSDFGYATSGGNTSSRSTCLESPLGKWNDEDIIDCKENDWLYTSNRNQAQWTIVPGVRVATAHHAFYISTYTAFVDNNFVYAAYSIYPTVYLKSDVKIVSGDGSESNPFKLSLN